MNCQGKKGLEKQKEVLKEGVSIGNALKEFVQKAREVRENTKAEIEMPSPSGRFVSFVKSVLDLDIAGYKRKIDNYAIKHIFNSHGKETELKRGQIPVSEDDFIFYDDIVTNYDKIARGGKTKQGRDTIAYLKHYGDTIYVVEEVRTGKKTLTPVTMWKMKATTPDAPGFDWKPAPRLNAQSVSLPSDGIIPKKQTYSDKVDGAFSKAGEFLGKIDEAVTTKATGGWAKRTFTISDITKKMGEITHDFRVGTSQIHEQAAQVKEFLDMHLSPDESAMMHKALTGDMEATKLPEHLRNTYKQMRDLIDTNADALVKAGALAEKNKIQDYLKRYYEEHLNEGGLIKKFYFDKRFKARKELTYDERIALGMIEDANFVIPKTLAEQRIQLLKANTLKNVADAFASDVEKEGFVRMSDESMGGGIKKYGALSGKWVPKEVADAVKGAGLVKENMGALETLWYPIVDHIKVNLTVKNPFTHLYNVGSNMMLSFLHGDMGALTKVLSMAVNDKRRFDALVKRANKYGLNSSLDMMEKMEAFNDKKEPIVMTILKNAYFSKGSKSGDFARHAYEWEDKIFKIAAFYRHLSEGVDEKSAFKLSQEAYVDYTTPISGALRVLDKVGIMPFIHYSYKATPMVLKAIAKNPMRFAMMQAALLGSGASAWLGDNERANMYKPSWAASSWAANAFGVKSWVQLGGGWQLNAGRLVPGMRFDGFDTLEFSGGFVGGAFRIANGETPLGYNIDGKYDSNSAKIAKRVLAMAENYLPPMTFGRYGQRAVGKATGLKEPKNYYDEPMTYTEMLFRGAGVRLFNEKKEVLSKARAAKNAKKHAYEEAEAKNDSSIKRKADEKYNLEIGKLRGAAMEVQLDLSKF